MGRAKAFEEQDVLEKAMRLFWEQGYEKTSMQDLVEHMGIHRRSLYDTFGDKHQLFLKSMELYGKQIYAAIVQEVKQASTAREGIHAIFRFVIERSEDRPPGCMLVNTAVELGIRDEQADGMANEGFMRTEELFVELIRKGQETGEFSRSLEANETAEGLHNALIGLRVLARTTTNKEKMYRIADMSLKILDK